MFVTAIEYIQSEGISIVRGSRLLGQRPPERSIWTTEEGTSHELVSVGYTPSRGGLMGKLLSGLTAEGCWALSGRVANTLTGTYLGQDGSPRHLDYQVEGQITISVDGKTALVPDGEAIPVTCAIEGRQIKGVVLSSGSEFRVIRCLASGAMPGAGLAKISLMHPVGPVSISSDIAISLLQ